MLTLTRPDHNDDHDDTGPDNDHDQHHDDHNPSHPAGTLDVDMGRWLRSARRRRN
jgi:hypothetical protein